MKALKKLDSVSVLYFKDVLCINNMRDVPRSRTSSRSLQQKLQISFIYFTLDFLEIHAEIARRFLF